MKKLKTIRKTIFVVYVALIMVSAITTPIYAANDPVTVVNNFSDFMFGMIRAIGMILLGFGIVQVGLSLKSQWVYDSCWWNRDYLCQRNTEHHRRLIIWMESLITLQVL